MVKRKQSTGIKLTAARNGKQTTKMPVSDGEYTERPIVDNGLPRKVRYKVVIQEQGAGLQYVYPGQSVSGAA